ncbi:riboflavin transporter MCH5 [Sodiomyces alkalinus F11]|uniref:Riboflavin transporter MCH5 n=1 Tax=Sodiomyces alkalinus (strain CBS 110278 / VKM F-3762 / F11) TaxID=1314773 RepID=A0A3N2PPX1_SODAK|nr:riboflavin transporter MCH5 [Sodiomyces alkalinus F11]ROT36548.1 riboflavin transporter MCH5 [Sodiomyces alkalinus F11]
MTCDSCRNAEDSCLKNRPCRPGQAYNDVDRDDGNVPSAGPARGFSGAAGPETPTPPDAEKTLVLDSASATPPTLARVETNLDFPEGGLAAWLVVFGSFCAMLSVFGLINTAAVFESYFSTNQLADYSSSEIGWIFSLYLFIVFFVGIQVGPIFDKHGPRIVVPLGGLLISASLLMLGVCEEYYQIILSYAVVGGLGGALLNSPAYGAIAHFFDAKRGFATGIAATAGSIGGIVFPILLQRLLPTLGFGWTTRILGLILLGLALPATLFIRTRLPPRDTALVRRSVWPDLTMFRDLKFTLSAVGIFFMEWGLFVPLTYIVSYAARFEEDATDSYTLLSLLNAGSVLGRFLPGFLADKVGRFNVILASIALCVATVLGLWLPAGDSRAMLMAFAVLFGFASGSNLGLTPVCLGQLCDPRDYGRFLSTALMVASFGTLSSLPIAGAILEAGDHSDVGWMALIVFAGLSYLLALGCFLAARVLAVGWGVKKVF